MTLHVPYNLVDEYLTNEKYRILLDGSEFNITGIAFAQNDRDVGYSNGATVQNGASRYLAYDKNRPPHNSWVRHLNDDIMGTTYWTNTADDNAVWTAEFVNNVEFKLIPKNHPTISIFNRFEAAGIVDRDEPRSFLWRLKYIANITYNNQPRVGYEIFSPDNESRRITSPLESPEAAVYLGFVNSIQLFHITKPSTNLQLDICTSDALWLTNACRAVCLRQNCTVSLQKHCIDEATDTNVLAGVCLDWCGTNKAANCDTSLEQTCASLFTGNNANLIHEACACFLPNLFYDTMRASYEEKIGYKISGNFRDCFYPKCAESDVKRFSVKLNGVTCPSIVSCANNISIDGNGTINSISISQTPICKSTVQDKNGEISGEDISKISKVDNGNITTDTSTGNTTNKDTGETMDSDGNVISDTKTDAEIQQERKNAILKRNRLIIIGLVVGGIIILIFVVILVYLTGSKFGGQSGGRR